MMIILLVYDIAIQSMNSGRWLDAMNSIMETMHIIRSWGLDECAQWMWFPLVAYESSKEDQCKW